MGEEQALTRIQRFDLGHFISSQCKIEHVKVLFHAVTMNGLRNDDNILLEQEAKGYLRTGLTMRFTDSLQRRVIEEIIATFSERAPGHNLNVVLLHVFLGNLLLLEHMRFYLVNGGFDFSEMVNVDQAVRIEVRHADSAHLTGLVRIFHSAIRTIVIAERLMQQQQIHIIGLQFLQRFVDGLGRFLIAEIANPNLRGDK